MGGSRSPLSTDRFMDDEDLVMGEDMVIASTEVNGNHASDTVNPAMISLNPNQQAPLRTIGKRPNLEPVSDELDMTTDAPRSPTSYIQEGVVNSSVPDIESDDMDFTYARTSQVEVRIPPPPRFPRLPYSSSKTGLVYDARMRFHCEPLASMIREDDIHPEDPRRIYEIFEEIRSAGLVQGSDEDEEDANDEQCWRIHARAASKAEICLVHTPDHYDFIKDLRDKTEEQLKSLSDALDSIYFHRSTFDCARLAAGGAIEACRAVVRGDVRNAIAIIRPPGHHAECDQPSGFCIFNNVPIAARVCQNDFPNECRKVLILDWDVHHGNGIQHAFYDDPNVLYISIHVYKNMDFYPSLPDGNLDYCGRDAGLGRNVNIPWAEHGMGDAEYLHAFQEIVIPIATEFDPDLVIISAGFDAAEGDILGGCHVTPACYAHMTHMLMRLAKGKIAVCLEGGYNLRSIARSALAVTKTLMLQPPERLAEDLAPPKESAVRTIEEVKREQSKYWKCIFPKHPSKEDPTFGATLRLHDIIREWQSNVLAEAHQMIPLAIRAPDITLTFEHNVVATPRFMESHPLLVIFHDPPDVMNRPDPVTGSVELHNIWLTDVTKNYIDWAIEEGFQVIDVNIPKVVDFEDEEGEFVRADNPEVRAFQTRRLANYLWENYIEPHDATQVFMLGIGAPYLGVVDLLSRNENTTGDRFEHLIGFISESPIHSIKRVTDDNIPTWFYEHSLVFVASDHHVWDPNRQRKLRKKYGNLKKSGQHSLSYMLQEHMEEVKELLLSKKKAGDSDHENGVRSIEEHQEVLRSPPLGIGGFTQTDNGADSRKASATPVRSPRMPAIGYFSASPHSPMKRNF